MHIHAENNTLNECISNAAFRALHLEERPILVSLQLISIPTTHNANCPFVHSKPVIGSTAHIPPHTYNVKSAQTSPYPCLSYYKIMSPSAKGYRYHFVLLLSLLLGPLLPQTQLHYHCFQLYH